MGKRGNGEKGKREKIKEKPIDLTSLSFYPFTLLSFSPSLRAVF
jgi:hypothetical protein